MKVHAPDAVLALLRKYIDAYERTGEPEPVTEPAQDQEQARV